MLNDSQIAYILDHAVRWSHTKSGWHGGQNVNKRETKAEWYLHIDTCPFLQDEDRHRLKDTYAHQVSKEGELRLTCQEQRNLHANMVILKTHFHLLFVLLGNMRVDEYQHRQEAHHHKH